MMYHSHYLDKKSIAYFSEALTRHFVKNHVQPTTEIVVVGIGTNRSSGDSLGPMVGSRLTERFGGHRLVHIYGTLEKPVHALNMNKMFTHIAKMHPDAYVIAVDACLGQFFKIGTIQLVEEPLAPGASLGKTLPAIGNLHIKGIINNYGPLNHKVLEHTSLTFVHEMAAVVSRFLVKSCQDIIPLLTQQAAVDEAAEEHRSSGT